LSVIYMHCNLNSLTEEPVLMKLYTVAVYNFKMCMKEDNPGLNYLREIMISASAGILL